MEVEWQLYEKRTRAIVYTATTGGTGKADTGPNGAEDAFYRAVTAALRNLLIDQQFAGRLVRVDAIYNVKVASTYRTNHAGGSVPPRNDPSSPAASSLYLSKT